LAVTGYVFANYVPVFRVPNDINKYQGLIGRWHGYVTVPGDASGGEMTAYVSLANFGQVFQAFTLYDIQFISHKTSATITYGYYRHYSSDKGLLEWNSFGSNWMDNPPFTRHLFKYRIDQGGSPAIECITDGNAGGKTLELACGGRIWDERFIVE